MILVIIKKHLPAGRCFDFYIPDLLNKSTLNICLLMHALFMIHEQGWDSSKEVICNIELPLLSNYCNVSIPQRGDKKKLIDFSLKNAWHTLTRYDEHKKEKYAAGLGSLK